MVGTATSWSSKKSKSSSGVQAENMQDEGLTVEKSGIKEVMDAKVD